MIRAGDGSRICSPDLTWVNTQALPAGCLKDGRLSASGTVAKGETKDAPETKCEPDGTWADAN